MLIDQSWIHNEKFYSVHLTKTISLRNVIWNFYNRLMYDELSGMFVLCDMSLSILSLIANLMVLTSIRNKFNFKKFDSNKLNFNKSNFNKLSGMLDKSFSLTFWRFCNSDLDYVQDSCVIFSSCNSLLLVLHCVSNYSVTALHYNEKNIYSKQFLATSHQKFPPQQIYA